jgi:hypothetical protein
MTGISTSIVPPGLPTIDDEDEIPEIEVRVELVEADGTCRMATATLPASASDVDLSYALVCCLRGLAEMRGPGLRSAVQRWVPEQ